MDALKLRVLTALKTVVDPEVGLNVVDLGLVYNLSTQDDEVSATMTLTTRGCPMGDSIMSMAQEALNASAGERPARLKMVWDPPWNPRMISEEGRARLG